MSRPVSAAVVVVALAAVLAGAWWLFVRDDPVPGEAVCAPRPPMELAPEVVAERPHDPEAFTQGLLVADGALWESTGQRGSSQLRRVDPATGEVLAAADLRADLFGEGLAVGADDELVQLTWTSGTALRWAPDGPSARGSFDYEGEGWGLTTLDDGELVMSDGTETLAIRAPQDFSVGSLVGVERDGDDVGRLNELDWDGEHVWANRYQTDEILRIDLDCGVVDAVVDASSLTERTRELIDQAGLERDLESREVLNGIAWLGSDDPQNFYVTGKRWPVLYEVRFVPA